MISKDTPTYRVTFLAALYRPAAIEALDSSNDGENDLLRIRVDQLQHLEVHKHKLHEA